MRIRTRLTLAIAGVLLITIASLGYVLVRDTRAALVQDVDEDIVQNAQRKGPKPNDHDKDPNSYDSSGSPVTDDDRDRRGRSSPLEAGSDGSTPPQYQPRR